MVGTGQDDDQKRQNIAGFMLQECCKGVCLEHPPCFFFPRRAFYYISPRLELVATGIISQGALKNKKGGKKSYQL